MRFKTETVMSLFLTRSRDERRSGRFSEVETTGPYALWIAASPRVGFGCKVSRKIAVQMAFEGRDQPVRTGP
jgi:hypothetical protein